MPTADRWLLYGAYGFTGSLIARAAAAQGVPLVLAGRRKQPLAALAAELSYPCTAFALGDGADVRNAVEQCAGVLNCAGPFARTWEPLVAACLATGRHYLDITGEIDVFEAVHAHDAEAHAKGAVLCPGVGFDVVPTDCLGAALKEALPSAQFLTLGFDAPRRSSPGTARTVVEGLADGCRTRVGKWLTRVPFGELARRIDFGNGEKLATAVPWGDVATALYSTGIGNVQVYVPVSARGLRRMRQINGLRPLLALPPVRSAAAALAARVNRGPGERELAEDRVQVWGEARGGDGLCAVGRLSTPNAYAFTRDAAVAAVRRLMEVPPESGGYFTPSRLFGTHFVETLPGVEAISIS